MDSDRIVPRTYGLGQPRADTFYGIDRNGEGFFDSPKQGHDEFQYDAREPCRPGWFASLNTV